MYNLSFTPPRKFIPASHKGSAALVVIWVYVGENGNRNGAGEIQHVYLNASRSSSIYGKSTTVQPPAVTVRYLIKAA